MDRPDFDPPVIDAQPDQPTPPLWAHFVKDSVYITGDDLRGGDTIYLSKNAYPRVLWTKLSRTAWSVLVKKHNVHERGQISIDPAAHYVVKRATRR